MNLFLLAGLYVSIAMVLFFCLVPFIIAIDEQSGIIKTSDEFTLASAVLLLAAPLCAGPRWLISLLWPLWVIGGFGLWWFLLLVALTCFCIYLPFHFGVKYGVKAYKAMAFSGYDPVTQYFRNLGKKFVGEEE